MMSELSLMGGRGSILWYLLHIVKVGFSFDVLNQIILYIKSWRLIDYWLAGNEVGEEPHINLKVIWPVRL